jgi:hypothetical protein
MTHRTTTSLRRSRRAAAPVLVALALVGTTAVTSPASAAPAAAPARAAAGQTTDIGHLTSVSRTALVFDRVVLLTGAAAKAEQRRRGLDTAPDFYVRNDNRLLRTRRLAPGVAVVGSQFLTGSPAAKPVTLDRLRSALASRPKGRSGPLFRLTLDRSDRVVRIAEVYLP